MGEYTIFATVPDSTTLVNHPRSLKPVQKACPSSCQPPVPSPQSPVPSPNASMRRGRWNQRLLVLLVALMRFGAQPRFAVAARLLDHPRPVHVAGGAALGPRLVDDLVEAAGEAARARG